MGFLGPYAKIGLENIHFADVVFSVSLRPPFYTPKRRPQVFGFGSALTNQKPPTGLYKPAGPIDKCLLELSWHAREI